MTYPIIQRELTVHLNNEHWYLKPIEDPSILGPVDYGWNRYRMYPDSFSFGEGLLAGSSIPGSRRLVFTGWSSQWDGFYISSMGGAAYTFHGVGVNYVSLRGRAPETSVLLLNHKQGEIFVRLEPVNVEALWNGYADPEGRPLVGFFALQQALFDRYKNEYPEGKMRICAVGPSALYTHEGAIGSNPVRRGTLSVVADWAGRGGLGSRLLQTNNLAAIIFGGEWEDPDLRDSSEIDAYFLEHFGKKTIQTDISVTEKYRYVPEFETGGTFGVNNRDMAEKILSFNYTSIYHSDDERLKQHDQFILKHYLTQFNEETIKTKNFQHCGEPCPVVCKKINDIYKKDYEPYHALGPQIGVFDQRAAEQINDYADAMGFDAIQVGGTIAWIMDIVANGLIPPEDFNLPPASELAFQFTDDPAKFDLVKDSARNAAYARAIIDMILFDPAGRIFRLGIREAARELDKKYHIRSIDRAVFTSHGDEGHMVPNQYWVAGMFSPMPMMGKYFVFYENKFLPPDKLGRKNVERMTYELFNENSGICRFHRKWSETITDEILAAHYGLKVNYKEHQFNLARAIHEGESPKSVFWESERVVDLMVTFLEQWSKAGLKDEQLDIWLERFHTDKMNAAREWWKAVKKGIDEAFAEGAQSIPDAFTPGQSNKLQV
ncbi:aldehyde ferredoxin oxidoreductase C-terminal domain-containing protein [Leptolinea tardivitalis]|uniref:aldehyde ferredoxin oxidoreductase C-terminal domain-containing protein n=1 Tax=Leptolinea tardivitalis TaxID=229920 RepID=UPI000782C898|nr:aldehyde ferredoxin oxidoreductase C-terminal domain-containing protein [Leptolinea tardivitalis]GAP21326.1 glyceraldehyde-3-phosphate ferredoxin oxidoreductase [Leptolinea tardivitalis]